MKRSRLALAVLLSAVLLATIASPASAYVVRRPRLTSTGWYTIYQTFSHTSSGDGCSDFPGWSYKVAMSAYIYVGTTTFKVQTVTVKYTVTSGRIWADQFQIFGQDSSTKWPSTGPAHQGVLLYGGQSKTYSYTPSKTVVRVGASAVADLQNDSYFEYPGVSGDVGCQAIDIWVLWR